MKTMRDRRTWSLPKLFVSTRRLQKRRSQPRNTVLASSRGEDGFCSSETKYDRRTVQRTRVKVFVSARLLELGSTVGEDVGFRGNNFVLLYSTIRIE
jgi:hypothetical protein